MSKHVGHNFSGKIVSWKYCVKCGLITLNNKVTRKAMGQNCRGDFQ